MRAFLLDKYHTWYDWRLTLTAKDVSAPEPKTNYVDLDGMSGTLDLSEALTGEVAYSDRTVTASFRSSEGTFDERRRLLQTITTALHGRNVKIVEPDDTEHYFLGRVKIKSVEQDDVHIAFGIECICEPWRYAMDETQRRIEPNGETVQAVIVNNGTRPVIPTVTTTATAEITYNGQTTTLAVGTYRISGLRLQPGVNVVGVKCFKAVTFAYREAGL